MSDFIPVPKTQQVARSQPIVSDHPVIQVVDRVESRSRDGMYRGVDKLDYSSKFNSGSTDSSKCFWIARVYYDSRGCISCQC